MKTTLLTKIPAGSPAGEILKLAILIVATILTDKIGEVVKDVNNGNSHTYYDAEFKEV